LANVLFRKSCRELDEIHDGPLLGGAGGLEAGISALALRDQILPPTINQFNPIPNVIWTTCRIKREKRALITHFRIRSDLVERTRIDFQALDGQIGATISARPDFPLAFLSKE